MLDNKLEHKFPNKLDKAFLFYIQLKPNICAVCLRRHTTGRIMRGRLFIHFFKVSCLQLCPQTETRASRWTFQTLDCVVDPFVPKLELSALRWRDIAVRRCTWSRQASDLRRSTVPFLGPRPQLWLQFMPALSVHLLDATKAVTPSIIQIILIVKVIILSLVTVR